VTRRVSRQGSAALDAALQRYEEEIRSWGERMNLVGSTEPAALGVHVSDALAAASEIPKGARIVDLGSGAGFPGIPIQLARPDVELTLVEGRERRYHFLRHAVRVLGLRTEVLRARIEDPPGRPYDVALLRAVASLAESIRLAGPWVSESGEIWVWTREEPALAPGSIAGEIPLDVPERGRILRVRAAAVPRGTP
jgi:16S rRNA (guanine527-N7)-methyltransferase